ncbi:hypothetical protein Tco_0706379 [Tanacetum coccineum]|uniref:Uncharacterized protein n=1 Tax=Tanacetum coccineum TaxID=301880 RepID=A0ABQ4Y8T0_9ASTR
MFLTKTMILLVIEDALPSRFTSDSDAEDLINMSADVALSHRSKGTRKPNLERTGAAGLKYPQTKTRNLSQRGDRDPVDPQAAHGISSPLDRNQRKASTCTCKKPTIPTRLLSRPSIERQTPPPGLTMWRRSGGHVPRRLQTAARDPNRWLAFEMRWPQTLRSTLHSLTPSGGRHDTVDGVFPKDEDRRIYEEMKRLEATGEYTEDEINALARGGKLCGHIPGVGQVFPSRATSRPSISDNKYTDMFKEFESGGASGSGGCGDDEESGDDEDDDGER